MLELQDPDISNAITKLAGTLSCHVVPIFQDNHINRPEPIGSGLILKHLGEPYLITAAHVVTDHCKNGPLYFYASAKRKCTFGANGLIRPQYCDPATKLVENKTLPCSRFWQRQKIVWS